MNRTAPVRKLPIAVVVKRAFLYSWESRHILAMPVLIFIALTFAAELAVEHFAGPQNLLPKQVLGVVEELFILAFAVGIHRFVLLGETPPGFRFYRWDRHLVRYALVTIALLVVMLIAAAPVLSASFGGPDMQNGGMATLGSVTLVFALIIVTRLSLLLPAAAIGDETRAKTIWEASEGNSVRLLGAMLITSAPFLVVEALGQLIGLAGTILKLVLAIGLVLNNSVQLIVLTVLLALCYDLLVRGNGPVIADRRNG